MPKSNDEASPSGGSMMTSLSVSVARCRSESLRTRIASIWFEIVGAAVELGAIEQREADVHDDEHVHAHLSRHVDGQVLREAAVHQQPPFPLDGREHTGRRQARAHRAREIAVIHHHRIAGLEIGRHRAERRRQAGQSS